MATLSAHDSDLQANPVFIGMSKILGDQDVEVSFKKKQKKARHGSRDSSPIIRSSSFPVRNTEKKMDTHDHETLDLQPKTEQSDDSVVVNKIKELGQYRSYLRRKAMGISPQYRGKIEPSDIVQQTLMEAHQKIDQFRGSSEPEMANWLSQMLSHNIADAVRSLRRLKRDIAKERRLDRGKSSVVLAADWLASDQSTPSLCVHKSEQQVRLMAAINELPEAQREVVILHHLQGKTLAEVAKLIDRSTSAVAGLL